MSEENLNTEAPAELPNAPVVPEAALAQSADSVPVAAEGTSAPAQSALAVADTAEIPKAEQVAPATPAESVDQISTEVAQTMHDLFQYIHDGFDQHSVMIGLNRFYEVAKAIKAKAGV